MGNFEAITFQNISTNVANFGLLTESQLYHYFDPMRCSRMLNYFWIPSPVVDPQTS